MKLALARADLAAALAFCARVVERRNTIPILSNLRLEAGEGRLRIAATDLDIRAETTCPAAVETPGATTVPAAMLADYVRRLPEKSEVGFALDADGTRAVVRAGRSRMALGALPAGDFPDFGADDWPHRFALPGRDLARLFGTVEHAITTDETRYYMAGIFLHALDVDGDMTLRAVATDGHRLGRCSLPCPAGAERMPGVTVPRKAAAEFKRLAEAAGEAEVAVSLSGAKIRLVAGEASLTSKLVGGTFPDYARVIPSGNGKVATVEAPDLARALERVAVIATERGRAVSCAVTDDEIVLGMKNPNTGDTEERVACRLDGAPLTIGFNGRYAADILAALDADTVEIAMADPGSPMLWRAPARSDALFVLMPMRAT